MKIGILQTGRSPETLQKNFGDRPFYEIKFITYGYRFLFLPMENSYFNAKF